MAWSDAFPAWTGAALVAWIVLDMALGSVPVPHEVADVASSIFGVIALGTIGLMMLSGRGPHPA